MVQKTMKTINTAYFSDEEIAAYNSKLEMIKGLKKLVIEGMDLSHNTFYHAMRGGAVSKRAKAKIEVSIKKVLMEYGV